MKTGRFLALFVALVLVCSFAYAADVSFPTSNTNELTLVINNNAGITAFNLSLDREISSITNLTNNKFMYRYENNLVVYSLDKNQIASGNIAKLKFNDILYGVHTISITNIVSCNGQAVNVAITGGNGTIAITFQPQDVHNTFMGVVDPNIQGIDVDGDGTITVIDGQIAANNIQP